MCAAVSSRKRPLSPTPLEFDLPNIPDYLDGVLDSDIFTGDAPTPAPVPASVPASVPDVKKIKRSWRSWKDGAATALETDWRGCDAKLQYPDFVREHGHLLSFVVAQVFKPHDAQSAVGCLADVTKMSANAAKYCAEVPQTPALIAKLLTRTQDRNWMGLLRRVTAGEPVVPALDPAVVCNLVRTVLSVGVGDDLYENAAVVLGWYVLKKKVTDVSQASELLKGEAFTVLLHTILQDQDRDALAGDVSVLILLHLLQNVPREVHVATNSVGVMGRVLGALAASGAQLSDPKTMSIVLSAVAIILNGGATATLSEPVLRMENAALLTWVLKLFTTPKLPSQALFQLLRDFRLCVVNDSTPRHVKQWVASLGFLRVLVHLVVPPSFLQPTRFYMAGIFMGSSRNVLTWKRMAVSPDGVLYALSLLCKLVEGCPENMATFTDIVLETNASRALTGCLACKDSPDSSVMRQIRDHAGYLIARLVIQGNPDAAADFTRFRLLDVLLDTILAVTPEEFPDDHARLERDRYALMFKFLLTTSEGAVRQLRSRPLVSGLSQLSLMVSRVMLDVPADRMLTFMPLVENVLYVFFKVVASDVPTKLHSVHEFYSGLARYQEVILDKPSLVAAALHARLSTFPVFSQSRS